MRVVGLDIGSYAIKALVAKQKGDALQVEQSVEVPNPIGAVFPDSPQKRQQLVEWIAKMFDDYKLPTVGIRVSLPESAVATKVVSMPLLSDAELASAIQWQVEQHIPIPIEEMQYEYSVLRRSDRKDPVQTMDVLMIGGKKQVIQSYADILLDSNLDVESMETDTLSQLRVVQHLVQPDESVALLHIGASSSVVCLVSQGSLQFVHAIPVAGILFSRAIERGVGLDPQRAEEYKRTYGLLANQLEGRVRASLTPIFDSLILEVQKAVRFFDGQNPGKKLTRVFVTGGSIYLPDLLPYLSQSIALEMVPVELAPFETWQWNEPIKQDGRFIVAAGLALKTEK